MPSLFRTRTLYLAPLLFLTILYAAHRAVLGIHGYVEFDCPPYWPFSVFNPRSATAPQLLTAFVTAVVSWFGVRFVVSRGCRPLEITALAVLLILGSNAVQGIQRGFADPVEGGKPKIQYYHDAKADVSDAATFLRQFNTRQALLRDHGKTHPPGAVLVFHALRLLTGDQPGLIGVLIAVAATALTTGAASLFFSRLLPNADAHYSILLLLVLPAVQIYYCATLDALIAVLLLAAVALWADKDKQPIAIAGACLCVLVTSFLTFGFVWVMPVLAVLSLQQKRWGPFIALLVSLAGFYGILYALLGFNYASALRTASHLENPQGFRLLAEPVSYLFTRLENITEIVAFFGPYLLLLFRRGLVPLRQESPNTFVVLLVATGTLIGLFLTGAYRTGETARVCLFLWPYLLLPVVPLLRDATPREKRLLLLLLFGQALIMQILGAYFW
jgi:hypothetical protein